MNAELGEVIRERLAATPPSRDRAAELVMTALAGPEELAAALEGRRGAADVEQLARAVTPAAAYLAAITVEGFRGVAGEARLDVPPGNGLTVVVGRNGSGKSSFAEAAELVLTGRSLRWDGRPRVWLDGWRNLHHRHTRVSLELAIDGRRGLATIAREWDDGAPLEAGRLVLDGKPRAAAIEELGWEVALATMRPLLSHNELGTMLDGKGPTVLYDALATLLGLDDLAALQRTLADARRERERVVEDPHKVLGALRSELEGLDDPRATRAFEALEPPRRWRLHELRQLVAGLEATGQDDELRMLRRAAALEPPEAASIAAVVGRLRQAAAGLDAVSGTDAERAASLAALLETALRHHRAHPGGDCPVCGRRDALGGAWRDDTRRAIAALSDQAAAVHAARHAAGAAIAAARALLRVDPAPASLHLPGVETGELVDSWRAWAALESVADPRVLASAIEARHPPLRDAITGVRDRAAARLHAREARWQPMALRLAEWLRSAERAERVSPLIADLRSAEQWLKDAMAELRAERFKPIAEQVRRHWDMLRHQSSVSLDELRLTGSGPQRKLQIDVSIDEQESAALGVMSQGELNCLSLSLFLPRASLPASPFRFVVIDDPVQAMDPAKVDGLARVLSAAAGLRQVIVFTHDERLTEAIGRLEIPAQVVRVLRRERSTVELRPELDPVSAHLHDAFALAHTSGLPIPAARLVPGFCRTALEAACARVVIRRLMSRGESHEKVEDLRVQSRKLLPWLALALYDDERRAADVLGTVNNKWGTWAGDAVMSCNRGTHERYAGDLIQLCRDSERLAGEIGRLPT